MDRRTFLASSGVVAFGAVLPRISRSLPASNVPEPFAWKTNDLIFSFDIIAGRLRPKRLVPVGASGTATDNSSGVEVALQCSGENSPDQGMKSGVGQPGVRLLFAQRREESTRQGKRLICIHTDPALRLTVESVYEAFNGVPVVRRYSRVTNRGKSPVGIEFLSSRCSTDLLIHTCNQRRADAGHLQRSCHSMKRLDKCPLLGSSAELPVLMTW